MPSLPTTLQSSSVVIAGKLDTELSIPCRVCHEPGHEPGSPDCKHYKQTENVVALQGKENPISNFFPCEIKIFGEQHQSAEHAYQLTKALRSGDLGAVEKVRNASTALDAKKTKIRRDGTNQNRR